MAGGGGRAGPALTVWALGRTHGHMDRHRPGVAPRPGGDPGHPGGHGAAPCAEGLCNVLPEPGLNPQGGGRDIGGRGEGGDGGWGEVLHPAQATQPEWHFSPSGVLATEDHEPKPPSSSLGRPGWGSLGAPQWLLGLGWGRLIPLLSCVPDKGRCCQRQLRRRILPARGCGCTFILLGSRAGHCWVSPGAGVSRVLFA